jgi:hypothetical protein
MTQLKTRRVRWIINGECFEQDAYCCSPEEWAALVKEYPALAKWAVFRFGARGVITAVSFPLGMNLVGRPA